MRKTRDFRDWVKSRASRQGQLPELSRQKFWKIYLSVFCDWKFYSRENCEVSRENLWVLSQLDLPPTNKSPDWVARNIKNLNFEKYSKYFSRLGHWPTSEPWKISVWARDWYMWWDQPVTELPKQGNIIFEIFDIFAKTKDFPKTTKYSIIFLCLINKDWACENTFNQVQSHKWIWHLLNIDMCDVCGYQQWDSP